MATPATATRHQMGGTGEATSGEILENGVALPRNKGLQQQALILSNSTPHV